MVIDERDPVADGVLFDDLFGCPLEIVNRMARRRVVWATSFRNDDGKLYTGRVVARDQDAAEAIAFGRGLGEEVTGFVKEVVPG